MSLEIDWHSQAVEDLRSLPSWRDAEVVDAAINAWARGGEGMVRVGDHAGDSPFARAFGGMSSFAGWRDKR